MMAVALVGAGEAIATRVSTGEADVNEAPELLINLIWRGLRGRPPTGRRRRDVTRHAAVHRAVTDA